MANFLYHGDMLGGHYGGDQGVSFVFIASQNFHLDQFVILQSAAEFAENSLAQPIAGNSNNGFEMMADGAKPFLVFLAYHKV